MIADLFVFAKRIAAVVFVFFPVLRFERSKSQITMNLGELQKQFSFLGLFRMRSHFQHREGHGERV